MNGFKWNRTSSYTWVGRAALKRQGINGSQYSRNHGDLLKLRDSRGGGAEAKNPSRKQMPRRKNLLDSRKSKDKGPKLESDWWSKGKQSSKHSSIADGEEKMGGEGGGRGQTTQSWRGALSLPPRKVGIHAGFWAAERHDSTCVLEDHLWPHKYTNAGGAQSEEAFSIAQLRGWCLSHGVTEMVNS